jgi:hypothetical protein
MYCLGALLIDLFTQVEQIIDVFYKPLCMSSLIQFGHMQRYKHCSHQEQSG